MDVVRRGVFANNHSACLCAELLMNRYRHTIPIDLDQESLQFEIVAQCFVWQVASPQDLGVIHCALTLKQLGRFDKECPTGLLGDLVAWVEPRSRSCRQLSDGGAIESPAVKRGA
jgi:hypothetical protein